MEMLMNTVGSECFDVIRQVDPGQRRHKTVVKGRFGGLLAEGSMATRLSLLSTIALCFYSHDAKKVKQSDSYCWPLSDTV